MTQEAIVALGAALDVSVPHVQPSAEEILAWLNAEVWPHLNSDSSTPTKSSATTLMASPVDAIVDTRALIAILLGESDTATAAFERYGKGRHPAGLNFDDCFAYALARQCNVPVLFKGDDSGQTDVSCVI